jgi:hypothetical protein
MKYIIILLLSTTGIQEIKLKGPNCEKLFKAWSQVNTTYYSEINEDPKLQGSYTHDGKLLVGYICD